MDTWLVALLVRPVFLLLLFWAVLIPARRLCERMPNGKLKQLLLFRVNETSRERRRWHEPIPRL